MGYSTSESRNKFKETNNFQYILSLSRLVVIKNTKENTIKSYLMNIVGDTDYLEKKNFKLWSNTYFKKDHDFLGSIFFSTVSGRFVNGWKYENGKVVGKIKKKIVNVSAKQSDSPIKINSSLDEWEEDQNGCVIMVSYEMYANCVQAYNHEGGYWYTVANSCGTSGKELIDTWEVCPEIVEEEGGAGDGSDGTGGIPGDKMAKQGMKTTMDIQIWAHCVTSIMGYINNEFCGKSENYGAYIFDYIMNVDPQNLQDFDGVDGQYIHQFVNRHFRTTPAGGVFRAIDNGHVKMTDIRTDQSDITHNVVITGYTESDEVIYMDPETGRLETEHRDSDKFAHSYSIEIKGCK